ncbi:MAG: hypothetical protein R3E66_05790 [bacterium]
MESLILAWFEYASSSLFFLIVPSLAFTAAIILMVAGRPKYVALPVVVIFGYIALHIAAMAGASHVNDWIAQTGKPGELVLTRVVPTGNVINHQPETAWAGTLKLADGSLLDWTTPTHSLRTSPDSDRFMPRLQTVLEVRYRPSRPSLAVILVDDPAFASRCAEIGQKIQDTNAKILLLSGDAKLAMTAKRDALMAELQRCAAP